MQEFKIGSSQQSQLSHIQAYNLKPYGKTEAVFIKKPIVGSDEIKYNHPGLKNLIKQYTIPTQVAILSDLYKFLVLGKKPTSDNFEGRMKLEELEDLTPENIAQFFAIHMSFTNTTTHKHDTDELYRDHFIKHELYLLPELYKTVRTTLTAPEHTKRANHLLDKLVEKLNSDIDTQVNSKISTERERASNDVSSLKKELTQSKEYISHLEEQISALSRSHERKSGEFEIARNKLEEITISRKNSGEELERTEKKINIARSRIEDLADRELKDPSFKEELINAKEEYNTLVSRYEELSSNFHELERECNTANRNVSEREREISRITLELLSITRNKDEAERDVLDLRQAIESEAVKHRREIVDLEEKYSKTAQESVFKAEMPLKTRVLELEESNQNMVKEINRLAEIIEKQYNQMVLAQSQFLSITRNKDEAERDVLDLRQAIESEAIKHRREIVDLEEKYSKTAQESVFKAEMPLKTRVLELEASNQDMVKEINRLAEIEKQYNQMILAQSQFKAPVEMLEKAADLI